MSAIKYYKSGGKRYYVIAVSGYVINPAAAQSGNYRASTTYAVLDRDTCHREMGVFTPRRGFATTSWARRSAHRLADKLNERERTYGRLAA